ncbi:FUSC family protein [Streptomyces taklimakanensis]|nr:aromatic acid exporter family protein [Streptomyces taklimakanensis]
MVHTQSATRSAPVRRAAHTVRAEVAWGARALRRAWRSPGRERNIVIQSGKAALAAILAWLAAAWLLPNAFALMAPWVAVVLVQSTVYRSVWQGLQQTLAITTGTVLAAALGIPFGHPVLVMIVVLPLTTLVGNWPRFGNQGIYAATAALFTLVPGQATLDSTVSRLLAALLGTAIGIAVNALVLPPSHLRSAREAVDAAVREAREVITDLADGLDEPWEYDRVSTWHERTRRLPRAINSGQSAIDWSRESLWFNPDRRRRAEAARQSDKYGEALATLEEVSDRLQGLTRTLVEAADENDEEIPRPDHAVTRPYSAFLRKVADALDAYGRSTTGDAPEAARRELREAIAEARDTQEEVRTEISRYVESTPENAHLTVFGPLMAEARRLAGALATSDAASKDSREDSSRT